MKKITFIYPILLSTFVFFWYTNAEEFSQEMREAYQYSYERNITTINDINKADMNWWLTRIAMAKMLSNYAINSLGRKPDISIVPNFKDVSSKLDADYNNWVTLAYQLWIMWIWIDKFRPYDFVTRAEFWTAFSRVLFWNSFNQEWAEYYVQHLQALKRLWIMNQIDKPQQWEVRWFVMIMLLRSDKKWLGHWNWNWNSSNNNPNDNPIITPNQNNNKTWDNKPTTWNNQASTWNNTSSWGWWWGGWGWGWWWGGWGWWGGGWGWGWWWGGWGWWWGGWGWGWWWGGWGWWWGGWGSNHSCKNLPANAAPNNTTVPSTDTNYSYSKDIIKICTFQCKSGYTWNTTISECEDVNWDTIDWELTIYLWDNWDIDWDSVWIPLWYEDYTAPLRIESTVGTDEWLILKTITLAIDDLESTATADDIESVWLWWDKRYSGLDWIVTDIQPLRQDWTVTLTFRDDVYIEKYNPNYSWPIYPTFHVWIKTKSTATSWRMFDLIITDIETNLKTVNNGSSNKRSWLALRWQLYKIVDVWECDGALALAKKNSSCSSYQEYYEKSCPARYIQKCNYIRPELELERHLNTNKQILRWKTRDIWYIKFNKIVPPDSNHSEPQVTKITFVNEWTATSSDIVSMYIADENKEKISDVQTFTDDWIVTITIDQWHDYVTSSPYYIMATTAEDATIWKTIKLKTDSIRWNLSWWSESFNLDNTYTMIVNDVVDEEKTIISISPRGWDKIYNWQPWEYFEINKFRIASADNDIMFKWFDLANTWNLILTDNNSDIKVDIDGTNVSNLTTSISNDKLHIGFDTIHMHGGSSVVVTTKAKLMNFNQYWTNLQYSIVNTGDIIVEEDIMPTISWIVLTIDEWTWPKYVFEWGKITLSNVDLWNIEVWQWTKNVQVAAWIITVTEPVSMAFSITTSGECINKMVVIVWWKDEYEARKEIVGSTTVFNFTWIKINESWVYIRFYVDVDDNLLLDSSVLFSALSNSVMAAKYYDSDYSVLDGNIIWSISFSNLNILHVKASLINNITEEAEFPQGEVNTKTVFSWIYTAEQRNVYLNDVIFSWTKDSDWNDITFYLYINGTLITNIKNWFSDSFDSILVSSWNSVNIRVDAEIDAKTIANYSDFYLTLQWQDDNWNYPVWVARDNLVPMKIVTSL